MCYSDVCLGVLWRHQKAQKKVPKDPFFPKKNRGGVFSGTKSNLVCTRRQSGIGLDRRRSDFYPNKWPIWTYLGPFFKYANFDRR